MQFRTLQLQDRAVVQPLIDQAGCLASETSFATMLIWQDITHDLFCIRDGILFRRGTGTHRLRYAFPIGADDPSAALAAIRADAAEAGGLPEFDWLTAEQREQVALIFSDLPYSFSEQPELADYLYNTDDLAGLRGKKYHAKRNFVNRFSAEYDGRFRLCPITPDCLDAIWDFNRKWCTLEGYLPGHGGVASESCAIYRALANFEALEMSGQVLYVDNAIVAYSLASPISHRAADVHAEKALDDFVGAYAVINQATAQQLQAQQYPFINREEDLGLDGLRQAKASYHPAMRLMIWKARLNA